MNEEGTTLSRGCMQLRLSGAGSTQALRLIMEAMDGAGATREEVCALFPATAHGIVDRLLTKLAHSRMLVPSDADSAAPQNPENPFDVFCWDFEQDPRAIDARMNRTRLCILGVNMISRQLVASLVTLGVRRFEILDWPALRSGSLFDDTGGLVASQWHSRGGPAIQPRGLQTLADLPSTDILVAVSESGDTDILRDLNRHCIERNVGFLPVVLQDLIGFVGPLIIPGETACYECFVARQAGNLSPRSDHRGSSPTISTRPVVGFHPCMATILGDLAAFELTKFLGGFLPEPRVGALIEFKLLTMELLVRKPLKVPRCAVCSPLRNTASQAIRKEPFTPISQLQT